MEWVQGRMKNWTNWWRQPIFYGFQAESLGHKTAIHVSMNEISPWGGRRSLLGICQISSSYFFIPQCTVYSPTLFPVLSLSHIFFCLWAEFFSCSMIFFFFLVFLLAIRKAYISARRYPGIKNYLLSDTKTLLLLIITLSFTEEQMIMIILK